MSSGKRKYTRGKPPLWFFLAAVATWGIEGTEGSGIPLDARLMVRSDEPAFGGSVDSATVEMFLYGRNLEDARIWKLYSAGKAKDTFLKELEAGLLNTLVPRAKAPAGRRLVMLDDALDWFGRNKKIFNVVAGEYVEKQFASVMNDLKKPFDAATELLKWQSLDKFFDDAEKMTDSLNNPTLQKAKEILVNFEGLHKDLGDVIENQLYQGKMAQKLLNGLQEIANTFQDGLTDAEGILNHVKAKLVEYADTEINDVILKLGVQQDLMMVREFQSGLRELLNDQDTLLGSFQELAGLSALDDGLVGFLHGAFNGQLTPVQQLEAIKDDKRIMLIEGQQSWRDDVHDFSKGVDLAINIASSLGVDSGLLDDVSKVSSFATQAAMAFLPSNVVGMIQLGFSAIGSIFGIKKKKRGPSAAALRHHQVMQALQQIREGQKIILDATMEGQQEIKELIVEGVSKLMEGQKQLMTNQETLYQTTMNLAKDLNEKHLEVIERFDDLDIKLWQVAAVVKELRFDEIGHCRNLEVALLKEEALHDGYFTNYADLVYFVNREKVSYDKCYARVRMRQDT